MGRVRMGLAGLGVLVLAACGASPFPSRSPASSPGAVAATSDAHATSPLSPIPMTVTPAPSAAAGWRILPTQSYLVPGRLHDVTTFRGSLFAVGATDQALGVIWSSIDGVAWKSVAEEVPLDGMLLNSVTGSDGGLVVVGWSEAGAVALFSPDGISWSRQELPGSHRGSSIESVAWRSGRFVAVGGGGEPNAVVSWTSDDGRTWTPLSIVVEGNQASLNSVAAGPDGFVVDGLHRAIASVWTSPDGIAWKQSNLPSPKVDPGRLRYAGGQFFLATADGHILSSVDGQHWLTSTVPGADFLFDVASVPGGLVAVGRPAESSSGVIATAANGNLTHWTLKPADAALEGAIAAAATVSPSGTYLVGVGNGGSNGSVFLHEDPATLVRPSCP